VKTVTAAGWRQSFCCTETT